jgi:hypothetical protein
MALIDSLEVLANLVDFVPGASGGSALLGTALSVTDSGDGVGLRKGVVYEAEMIIQGAITGTSPTLAVVIQAEDSDTSWFNIGVFPTIGASGTPVGIDVVASAAASIPKAYFRVPNYTPEGKAVIAVRAYGTTTGTNSPTFNDVAITCRPALGTGSVN